MDIHILEEAREDLFKGAKFYEAQKIKLGNYFFDSVMSDIESLELYYGIHFKVKNYHRMLAKRFPYAIYYKYDEDTIRIYAILDCRSKPKNIEKRLK
jgi:hypothetical protein